MALIYRHIRLDNNETFYIGIGKDIKRPYSKYGRSIFWRNIVSKTEYEVQVLKNDLIWEEACELEKLLISYYGRKDLGTGTLVNMSIGGNGPELLTDLQKNKLSKVSKGRKFSEEHKNKISKALKGIKRSQETKDKVSIGKKGKTYSKEINMKKSLPMGLNPNAKKVEYEGYSYSCKKELWMKVFNNISYGHFLKMIRIGNIKINN